MSSCGKVKALFTSRGIDFNVLLQLKRTHKAAGVEGLTSGETSECWTNRRSKYGIKGSPLFFTSLTSGGLNFDLSLSSVSFDVEPEQSSFVTL